jgi:hypothetical protein
MELENGSKQMSRKLSFVICFSTNSLKQNFRLGTRNEIVRECEVELLSPT